MRCLSPVRVKNPNFPETSTLKFIDCGCGKCFNCLVNRRRMWFFRLFYESLYNNGTSYFVGLDYAPVHCDMQLHKDHLQRFFKSMRKRGLKFRYYAIGEFGTSEDKTHRPHYHALMFFKEPYCRSYIELLAGSCWKYGHVDVGEVEPASINYVLHYHVRPKNPFGDEDNRKTFSVMSQGLGLGFLDSYLYDIFQMLTTSTSRKVTNCFGDSFVLPRYYVKKLQDYGLPIKEFDGSNIDWSRDSLRDLIDKLDDSIEYYRDGRVKESSIDRWCSLVASILQDSKRKLSKYDNQEKVSSI